MKNILITGVAGLVGSNLAKNLLSDNNVIGVDNLIGGYKDNIPSKIKWINKDCADLNQKDFKDIDVVIHAACTPHEGLSIFSPKIITENTYGISMNVLTRSIQAGVKKFIFTSSMARYGTQDTVPFTENMIPNPQDPYGVSKVAFENNLKILSDVHNFKYTIIVPHNIVGPGQVYNDPFRNVVSIMINRMLQGLQPFIYGDGEQMRSFSHINDVINPLIKIINSDVANSLVINLGPENNYITINDLAYKIAKKINFNLNPIYLPDRPKEVKFANCSPELAKKILDYEPKIDIDFIIDDMIKFIKDKGVKPFNFYLPVEINNVLTPISWNKNSEIYNRGA